MMCMTKPLFGTGKSVVINSVFCVMKGLVGMLAHGVYRTTVINKNILAQVLHVTCFQDKEVGGVHDVCGYLYGNKYNIKCTKEAGYAMKLFRTHGLMSKRCRVMLLTYQNRGETITKICLS